MSMFRLEVGQVTDVGRKRTANEDNLGLYVPDDPELLDQIGALFVVADGMGGHAKGEVAQFVLPHDITSLRGSHHQWRGIISLGPRRS